MRRLGMLSVMAVFLTINFVFISNPKAQTTEELVQQANQYFQDKDWKNATKAFQQLVERDSTKGLYWYRLGQVFHAREKYKDAIKAYKHAVAIGNHTSVIYNLACAYSLSGQKDKALDWLEIAAKDGFGRIELLKTDKDLEKIRDDDRFKEIAEKVEANAHPCMHNPEHRQFDFWIGEWEVYSQAGQHVGKSSIQRIIDGCVIFENWTGDDGYTGKSFNFYNPDIEKWQQTWVDSRAGVIEFTGNYEDNKMTFFAQNKDKDGNSFERKLTFFNLSPDSVRQFSQRTYDSGDTWNVEYDFIYVRKQETEKQ